MHVGAGLALRRHAVDRARIFAVHQNDALVALAHFGNITLDDDRLAIEGGEHLQHRTQILVVRLHAEDARAAIAVKRLDDDVLVLGAEGVDLHAIRGDERGRHQPLELGDEQFLRRVAHMRRIVHHQRPGMDAFQQMRGRDVGHVEGRVLPHQHHIGGRKIDDGGFAQGEMIAARVAHRKRTDARRHLAIAKRQVARAVIEQRMAPRLRFQRQRKSGIAADIDPLDRVHLDCDGKRHEEFLVEAPLERVKAECCLIM